MGSGTNYSEVIGRRSSCFRGGGYRVGKQMVGGQGVARIPPCCRERGDEPGALLVCDLKLVLRIEVSPSMPSRVSFPDRSDVVLVIKEPITGFDTLPMKPTVLLILSRPPKLTNRGSQVYKSH